MNEFRGIKFQRFFYAFLRVCFGWLVCLIKNFHYEPCKTRGKTVLVLINHNSDFDPFYAGIGIGRHMKYVASANILEGFSGRIIKTLVDPIPRKKGASADDTVDLIIKNLKAGISVAMFPEGNKSWDGISCYISKRTAQLLKEAHCGLVTYTISGGYLKSPRWSDHERKGPLYGRMVKEYSAEELESMSVDEIYQAICSDLYVNAYEDQKNRMVKYHAKDLNSGISSVLYICPSCRRIGSISSGPEGFGCVCGLSGKMNEYGFLEGDGFDFESCGEWNAWQKKYLKQNADQLKKTLEVLTADCGFDLIKLGGEEAVLFNDAVIQVYSDRFSVYSGEYNIDFPVDRISRISTFRNKTIFFTCGSEYYKLKFKESVSGLKYDALWRTLTGREYI